jgi:hypothetical protein
MEGSCKHGNERCTTGGLSRRAQLHGVSYGTITHAPLPVDYPASLSLTIYRSEQKFPAELQRIMGHTFIVPFTFPANSCVIRRDRTAALSV